VAIVAAPFAYGSGLAGPSAQMVEEADRAPDNSNKPERASSERPVVARSFVSPLRARLTGVRDGPNAESALGLSRVRIRTQALSGPPERGLHVRHA
jgi:hypothetical protein